MKVSFYDYDNDTQLLANIGTDGVVYTKKDAAMSAPSAAKASQSGKKLVGWYAADTSGKPTTTAFDFSKPITEETKIFGKYATATTHEVTFRYHDGEDADGVKSYSVQYVVDGDTVTAPTLTFTNYTLEGWFEGDKAATPYDFTKGVTDNLELDARWAVTRYTVAFVTNGGTTVNPIEVESGSTYGDAIDMVENSITKTGQEAFYYKDAELTNQVVDSEEIKGNTTLYVKWIPYDYDMEFYYGTHKLTLNKYATVTYNEAAVEPTPADVAAALTKLQATDPTLSVATVGGVLGEVKGIAGWFTDSQLRYPYDWTTPVTKNTKLYGKFLNAVKVTVKNGSKVYDGKAIEPVFEVTPVVSGDPVPTTKVEYKVKGAADTTFTTTAPKDYGTYVVRVTAEANEKTAFNQASAEFSVSQAEVTLTWPENTALPFTGNEQAPVPTVVGAVAGETPAVTITGKQIKVGTGYKATASLPATGNYKFAATAVTECAFSIVENTVAPSKVEVKLDPTTGLPVGLILTNADGSTTEVPITGNDIFEVVKKDNGDGTGTVTISPKAGSGYNFAPITTAYTETLPKATAITALTAKKYCKLRVEWTPMVNVDGYEIQYNLKNKEKGAKTKTVKVATSSSLTLKKLTVKKRYYVRIRTYKTGADGKKVYSAWSAWKRASKKNKIFKKK